jgi:hypothetical protein
VALRLGLNIGHMAPRLGLCHMAFRLRPRGHTACHLRLGLDPSDVAGLSYLHTS